MSHIGGSSHRRRAPQGFALSSLPSVGGCLMGDLALTADCDFLAVAEQKLIPARARLATSCFATLGTHLSGPLPVRIASLVVTLCSQFAWCSSVLANNCD